MTKFFHPSYNFDANHMIAERRPREKEMEEDPDIDVDLEEEGEQVTEAEAGGSQVGVGEIGGEEGDTPLMSSSLLDVMSPKSKKKVFRRLSQEPHYTLVKKQLRKEGHRINLRDSQKELDVDSEVRTSLKKKVEVFLNEDSNSIPCPDKKKVGVRYRLDFLCTLHEKFLSEYPDAECSYSQFTRLVPPHIKKPKPTDWGTCLCMTCLNPQLMLEGLKRSVPGAFNGLTIEDDLLRYNSEELDDLKRKIVSGDSDSKKKKKKNVSYLHWEKVKTVKEREEEEKEEENRSGGEKKKVKKKSVTYVSEKSAVVDPPAVFADKFVSSLVVLKEHTDRRISQYRRIKVVRHFVDDSSNDAAALRIDWSENATLFQTRQEKGDYYKDIQVSVNTVVVYQPDGVVSSHASLSDFTSHRAPATWASLKDILTPLKYTKLFIISDSPTSQYRNSYNVFLTKKWAQEHNTEITWVFTETGHGKGPMDGVGGAMKRRIDNVIAFNPNEIIRCTDQLVEHLPESDIAITTYTREDVVLVQASVPKKITMKSKKKGLGVAKVHEIKFPVAGDDVHWKALSSDKVFITATISIKG